MKQKSKDDLSILQLSAVLLGGGAAICTVLAVICAAAFMPSAAGKFLVYAFWGGIGAAACIVIDTMRKNP